MTIGAALFTVAVGAVLAFAVTAEVAAIGLQIVGYILLAIAALGLVFGPGRTAAAGRPQSRRRGTKSRAARWFSGAHLRGRAAGRLSAK